MNAAYGWAFAKPVRKVFYNITITAISVAVALIIGTIELIGVLADQAKIELRAARRRSRPSRSTTPATASSPCSCSPGSRRSPVWRFGRIEEKWSANLAPGTNAGS